MASVLLSCHLGAGSVLGIHSPGFMQCVSEGIVGSLCAFECAWRVFPAVGPDIESSGDLTPDRNCKSAYRLLVSLTMAEDSIVVHSAAIDVISS